MTPAVVLLLAVAAGTGIGLYGMPSAKPATAVGSVDPLAAFPHVPVSTYEVAGESLAAIAGEIERLGPVDSDGRRWAGLTRWDFRWQRSGCERAHVTVSPRITVVVPALAPGTRLTAAEREAWRQFDHALRRHEAGHVERALASTARIRSRLTDSDCGEGNAAGLAAVAELNAEQEAYDRHTGHGASQGAQLPAEVAGATLLAALLH